MTPSSPTVTATALSRTYGYGTVAVHALRDIDLTVHAGVLTVVAGSAGSGKSTLLACLSGADRAVTGRVVQHSVRLAPGHGGHRTRLRPARVGVAAPPSCLPPSLTVAQAVRGRDGREDRDVPDVGDVAGLADAVLGRAWWHVVVAALGLREHLAATVGDLGPAERQRVAIASALAARPDVLFVDDPAGGDARAVADVAACLRACAHRLGVGVVVATRDAALASRADRVVVLEDGRLVDDLVPARRRQRLATAAAHRTARGHRRRVHLQDDRAR